MAKLVARWTRLYTRNVPAPVAKRRIDEIDADLHDQIAHERAQGTSDRRIAVSIASRMLRGLHADASWRGRHAQSTGAWRVLVITACILAVPFVATQFSEDVAWTATDFVVAGVLIGGTGFLYRALTSHAGNTAYELAAALAVATALMLVWASLAVGVIGEDGDPADLMYLGVLAVGLIGALIARLRPEGMMRALVAMACAQLLVAAIALIAGRHDSAITSAYELIAINAFFAALFAGSAVLFRHARR